MSGRSARKSALAQGSKVNVILVTELTRWGRSLLDLLADAYRLQASE
jgi:hypothetical protein